MERWGALESSPEVFTSLLEALCGGSACAYEVVDLFAFDDEVLPMFPQVAAVIMAFPTGDQAPAPVDAQQTDSDDTYFLRQIEGGLSNACGTIALLHSVINSRSAMSLPRDSPALQFFDRTKDLTPDARGRALDSDETIAAIHNALVEQGDTAPLDATDVRHHYVAFVRNERGSGASSSQGGSAIIELDGYYKTGPQYHPIVHKPDCDDLLATAVEVIKSQYMQRLDEASTFSVLLVVPKPDSGSST